MRVVGVGADTLEAVQVEVAQTDDVGAEVLDVGVHADAGGLCDDLGDLVGRDELRCPGESLGLNAGGPGGCLVGLLGLVAHTDRVGDERHETGGIEVHIRQCGEQVEAGVRGVLGVRRTEFAQLLRVLPDTEVDLDQHVLESGGGGVLAAVTLGRRATEAQQIGAVGLRGAVGLLALVAKHGSPRFGGRVHARNRFSGAH